MEEKKNNAVEKVENIANKNAYVGGVNANGMVGQNNQSMNGLPETPVMPVAPLNTDVVNEQYESEEEYLIRKKQEHCAREKAERARLKKQKKVELARIKAQRKAEKQKLKVAAIREKNKRRAELEMRRQELEAERKAKIMANKRAKDENRRRDRQRNKDRNKGVGGWLAAVISLSIATLVLASVLTFTFLMPSAQDNMLEAAYHKSFYDTVEQVDNIDLNLSKALATADSGALQRYLVDAAINSELAENDI